jgi:hypothetical protein
LYFFERKSSNYKQHDNIVGGGPLQPKPRNTTEVPNASLGDLHERTLRLNTNRVALYKCPPALS